MNEGQPPDRLYKYRSFSNRTLSMIVEDTVHFSDPSNFNDPLDTKPTVKPDLSVEELEDILIQLVEKRTKDEMSAAAKAIKYRGPKTLAHIERHSRRAAEQAIAEVRYNATNPDNEVEDPAKMLLGYRIQEELKGRYSKGVFSLAERVNCPLMWSHYADQHAGLCLGYSVPKRALGDLHKVHYGGSRLVFASAVSAMLRGDLAARKAVDDAVLLRKAEPWIYEQEWRLLGQRGEQHSPLELEEVVFGLRCPTAVMYAVVQALAPRGRPVAFFEILERAHSFELSKQALDTSELSVSLPRRNLSVYEDFDDLTDDREP